MGIIYCARNTMNGKVYIGQTVRNLEIRKCEHRWCTHPKNAHKSNSGLFFNALRKYGFDAFEWTIVFDDVKDEELNDLEIETIAVYRSLVPNGYNLVSGGGSNGKASEELKEKLREAAKNRPPVSLETRRILKEAAKDRCRSSEATKLKIKEGLKGKPKSDLHRKNISEAAKRRKRNPHSEETKQKMSNSRKGKFHSDEAKNQMKLSQQERRRKQKENDLKKTQ